MIRLLLFLLALLSVRAAASQDDPMGTATWPARQAELFGDAPVVFDPRVRVMAPPVAEDPLQVPAAVDIDASLAPRRVVVFADYNPIVKVLAFEPHGTRPYLAFRLKMQQSGPLRAAVLDATGVWRVGHTWISTTGGGCTLPALARGDAEWERRLNEVWARRWRDGPHAGRVRFRILHPMDTGLAPGIPAFFLQSLTLTAPSNRPLMRLDVYEPVSENPVFTVDLPPGASPASLRLTGRDNNGNLVEADIP